jgi:hypothetical protein
MHLSALIAALALPWGCPATFHGLPSRWTHSDSGPILIGDSPATTTSWASTGRSGLLSALPRNGVYVEVILTRPAAGLRGVTVRPFVRHPRLARLSVAVFPKGPPGRGFQRVLVRFDHNYDVDLQVIYEQRRPIRATIADAQRAIDALRWPRWPRRAKSPPCA